MPRCQKEVRRHPQDYDWRPCERGWGSGACKGTAGVIVLVQCARVTRRAVRSSWGPCLAPTNASCALRVLACVGRGARLTSCFSSFLIVPFEIKLG